MAGLPAASHCDQPTARSYAGKDATLAKPQSPQGRRILGRVAEGAVDVFVAPADVRAVPLNLAEPAENAEIFVGKSCFKCALRVLCGLREIPILSLRVLCEINHEGVNRNRRTGREIHAGRGQEKAGTRPASSGCWLVERRFRLPRRPCPCRSGRRPSGCGWPRSSRPPACRPGCGCRRSASSPCRGSCPRRTSGCRRRAR